MMKMPGISAENGRKNSFSMLTVKNAMRRRVIGLMADTCIDEAIGQFIKHKVNAILILDRDGHPQGVLSKTEIIGAYYAALPLTTAAGDIMSSPVHTCCPGDSLELVLTRMQEENVGRLYVTDEFSRQAIGTLAYPDMVGLLYRYCHNCEFSLRAAKRDKRNNVPVPKILVHDIMTTSVKSAGVEDTLGKIIEELSMYKLGALLIKNGKGLPTGVISKTDLALAYKRGIGREIKAGKVMSAPVCSCDEAETLENGIHRMIFSEINRLFAFSDSPENITGVLSLSDAARARSGSCQACTTSRISFRPNDLL